MLSVSYECYMVVTCLSACCIRGMQSWVVGASDVAHLTLGLHWAFTVPSALLTSLLVCGCSIDG